MHNKDNVLWLSSLIIGLAAVAFLPRVLAQDQYDDPPTRVARLGYMEGSVSFQPAGETDWVGAVPNRPMTTGDQIWADQGSRAELNLGSAVIRLSEYTGITFLNFDDHTVQVQLSSGTINVTVRRLREDDVVEVDTPNLAFTIFQTGHYRMDASQDGANTTVSIRAGEGEATGYGQTYDLRAGQVGYFSGTNGLYADVEQVGEPDAFDVWVEGRDHRYDYARSRQYMSPYVAGFEDLDDYGEWRFDPAYGNIWFPNQVAYGWAPYHVGHWAWIDPWGYTWVDDAPWGYAPFHYGRWVFVAGRWGWVAGPANVEPLYAPALVVFIGAGGGWGGNIGWFPLGPREVWVPSYPVSRVYMTQVNVSSTVVNETVITNVYNTTIINKTTNITNITYVNKTVPGAVTAVPQNAFASAQPVAKVAVVVNAQQIASAPVAARVAVNPTRESVLGAKASTAEHVSAPPAAIASRQVVAKKTPPPPPVPFAQKQQAMAKNPGQPLPRQQLAAMRPAAAAVRPPVKVAPPGKPAQPATGHPPANVARPGMPGAPANAGRPAQPTPPPSQPMNRPGAPPPNERPAPAQPSRPALPAQPETNRPAPSANQPPPNRPTPPSQPNRPPANQPQPNRPETNRPPENQPNPPETRPAEPNRPPAAEPNRPAPNRNEPPPRQAAPPPERPSQQHAAPPPKQEQKQPPPDQKKREEETRPPGL